MKESVDLESSQSPYPSNAMTTSSQKFSFGGVAKNTHSNNGTA